MNPAIYIIIVGLVIGWCGQISAFRAGYEHKKAGTVVLCEVSRKFDIRGVILLHLGFAVSLGGLAYGMMG